MKIEDLKRMRSRAPFRPFQIHLANGEVLPVDHPEKMSLPEDEAAMFVIWTKSEWNLVEAEQVARVSVKRQLTK
jgi:hypothetical protein